MALNNAKRPGKLGPTAESFLAELTDAAYQSVLKHRLHASFVDVQLGLWSALRAVLENKVAQRRQRFCARPLR